MIDLIIPHYNNRKGLARTLDSINYHIFKVTVVDDCSTCGSFVSDKKFNWLSALVNVGPGMARQHGLDCTSRDWVMFIDAGDIFTSVEAQEGIAACIAANPQLNFISFPYFYNGKITTETDNRMHGKVYKREFLDDYKITFSRDASYLNEDVGFNRTCRLCAEASGEPMKFINLPVIEWIEEPNSITQKNNKACLYKDQTRALSLTSIHTIDILRRNHIDETGEINQIALSLYYWFIRTAAERPEYLSDAWAGARIFYKEYEKEIDPNKLLFGNAYMKKCLNYRGKIRFTINILRFTHDILTNENLPTNYLTFS